MPTTSGRRLPVPPLTLDASIASPALRLHAALRLAILGGRLAGGERLPSSREMAAGLAMGRNQVVAAYEHLMSDGLIEGRHGSGTYVAAGLPVAAGALPVPALPPVPRHGRRLPFALGQTDVDPDFLVRLGAAVRRHIAGAGPEALAYGDPRGDLRLREEVAAFLAAGRGLRCDPGCVVVTSGTQHGLRLSLEALLGRGDGVWMEDPGYGTSRATLRMAGMEPRPVPVDAQGLDVAAGRRAAAGARAALVTPSHQFPTGVVMSMERRAALIDWAGQAGAWIIEDDYDSEFRYSGPPLTALAGLAPDRVIYLGTFAKTLFPGLRLGYMVVPPAVLERVLAARAGIDRFAAPFLQQAVAGLMADGSIARQLRRNLRRYRAARDLVAVTLERASAGRLAVDLPEQGLHLTTRLPSGTDPALAAAIREASGVEAVLLSETRELPGAREGFVLGFSGHAPADLEAAATALGRAARAMC